jgi:hypothetical protein
MRRIASLICASTTSTRQVTSLDSLHMKRLMNVEEKPWTFAKFLRVPCHGRETQAKEPVCDLKQIEWRPWSSVLERAASVKTELPELTSLIL